MSATKNICLLDVSAAFDTIDDKIIHDFSLVWDSFERCKRV